MKVFCNLDYIALSISFSVLAELKFYLLNEILIFHNSFRATALSLPVIRIKYMHAEDSIWYNDNCLKRIYNCTNGMLVNTFIISLLRYHFVQRFQ